MCPPVIAIGRPQMTMRGPGASLRRMPSRSEKATLPLAPFSRSVVTPEWSRVRAFLRGLEEQDVVVFLRDVVAERAVARRHQVRVRVHEPGQDRRRRRSLSGPRMRRPEREHRPRGPG